MKTFSLVLVSLAVLSLVTRAEDPNFVIDKDMIVSQFEEVAYPPLALTARVQGTVVVRVKLDKDGKIVAAEALSGHPLLTIASIAGAKKMEFQPNTEKAAVIIFHFRLADLCDAKARSLSFVDAPASVTVIGCPGRIQT
jgi:TonB family protein